jgi:hypothetical protein
MPIRPAIFLLLGAFLCPAKEVPLPPKIRRQIELEIFEGKNNSNPAAPQLVLPEGPFAALFAGGIFPGKFLGIDPAKGIRWQHPAVAEPFHLKPGTVGFLQLTPTANAAAPDCEIRLVSGDQFTGKLISLDAKSLTLDATHCGRLVIPRQHISALLPRSAEGDALIQGFQNPAEWVFTHGEAEGGLLERLVNKQGRWMIKNNAAICPGGNGALLGRKLPGNPQAIRMDFDLRSPQGNPQIGFRFFTDNLTNHRAGHSLDLTFRKGKATAKRQPIDRDAGQNGRIGKSIPLPALGKRAAHITIHASLRPAQLHLAINGQHIGSWESEQPLEKFGAGILFVQRGKQPARIENLVIRKSSGHSPIGRQLPKLPAGLKQDHITFTNGDHIEGEIKEIKKGIAICKSSFGDIKLPLAKIRIAQLARKAILKHKRPEGAAVITLANQTQITGQLKIADAQTLNLTSPTLGKISIPLNAIRTINFQTAKNRIPGFPDPNTKPKNKKGNKRIDPMHGLPLLPPPPDFNP